jgi:hypothetical protein
MGVHRTGDVSGSLSQNGASLSVTGVDGKFYVKATPEFLREVKAPANACPVICGKWLPLPPQTVSQIASQLNLHNLTGALDSITTGKVSEVGSTTVNGKTAWVLKGANGVTVDVSTASPHYPLRAHAGNGKSGVVTFTQWNSVPKPTAPPASQIVNLNGQHT